MFSRRVVRMGQADDKVAPVAELLSRFQKLRSTNYYRINQTEIEQILSASIHYSYKAECSTLENKL